MKILVIISTILVAQVSASFYDVFQGAVLSVQNSIGKLLSDVATDVKDTFDCTIYAVEHVLSLSEDASARYYEKCGSATNSTKSVNHTQQNISLPTVEFSLQFPNNEEYLLKEIPAEIDAKINETLTKVLGNYNPHDELLKVENELAKETERLAEVSNLVKQELKNHSIINERNIKQKDAEPSIDSVLREIKLLENRELNTKNNSEAKEIHQVIDVVLKKLHGIESTEASENVKLEEILKDLENQSNNSFIHLRKQIHDWKEEESSHLNEIRNKIEDREALRLHPEYDIYKANPENTQSVQLEKTTIHLKFNDTNSNGFHYVKIANSLMTPNISNILTLTNNDTLTENATLVTKSIDNNTGPHVAAIKENSISTTNSPAFTSESLNDTLITNTSGVIFTDIVSVGKIILPVESFMRFKGKDTSTVSKNKSMITSDTLNKSDPSDSDVTDKSNYNNKYDKNRTQFTVSTLNLHEYDTHTANSTIFSTRESRTIDKLNQTNDISTDLQSFKYLTFTANQTKPTTVIIEKSNYSAIVNALDLNGPNGKSKGRLKITTITRQLDTTTESQNLIKSSYLHQTDINNKSSEMELPTASAISTEKDSNKTVTANETYSLLESSNVSDGKGPIKNVTDSGNVEMRNFTVNEPSIISGELYTTPLSITKSTFVTEVNRSVQGSTSSEKSVISTVFSYQPISTVTSDQPISTVTSDQLISTVTSVQPISNVTSDQPISTVTSDQPISTVTSDQPISTVTSDQPISTVTSDQPISTVTLDQPISTVTSDQPISNVTSDQPISTVTSDQPISNVTSDQPISTVTSDQPISNVTSGQPISTVTSDQPISTVTLDQPIFTLNPTFPNVLNDTSLTTSEDEVNYLVEVVTASYNEKPPITSTSNQPTYKLNEVLTTSIINIDNTVPNLFNDTSLSMSESTSESGINNPVEVVTSAYYEKPLTNSFSNLRISTLNGESITSIINKNTTIPTEFNVTPIPIAQSNSKSVLNYYPVEIIKDPFNKKPSTDPHMELISTTSIVNKNTTMPNYINITSVSIMGNTSKSEIPIYSQLIQPSALIMNEDTTVTNKINITSLPTESEKKYVVEVVTAANEESSPTTTLLTDIQTSTSNVNLSVLVYDNISIPNQLNVTSLPITESTPESEKKYVVEVVTAANDERPPTTTVLTDVPSSTSYVFSSIAVHDNSSVPNKLNVSSLPITDSEKEYPVEVVTTANEERPPTTTIFIDLTTSRSIVDSSMAVHENTSMPNKLNVSSLPISEHTTESEKKYPVEVITAANEERLPTTTLFTDLTTSTSIVDSSMAVHENTSMPNKLNVSSLPISEHTTESEKKYPVEVITAANEERLPTTTLFTDLTTSTSSVDSSMAVHDNTSVTNKLNGSSLPIAESTPKSEKSYPVEVLTAANEESPPTTTLFTDLTTSTPIVDSSMVVHDNTSVPNRSNGSSLPIAESTLETEKSYPVAVVTAAYVERPPTTTLFTDLPTSTSIVDSSMVVHRNTSVPNKLNDSSLPITESTPASKKKNVVEVVTADNEESPPTTTLLTDLPSSTSSVDSSMAVHDNTSVPNKLNGSSLPIAESTFESEKYYPVEVVTVANEERPPTTIFTDLTTSTLSVDTSMAVHDNIFVPNKLNGSSLPITESTSESEKYYPVEVVTVANEERPPTTIFTDLTTSTSIVDSSMVLHQNTSVPNKLNGSSLPITESTTESEKKYVVEVVTAANEERLPTTTLFTDLATPIVVSSMAVHDNTSVPNKLNGSSLPIAESTPESGKSYPVEVVTAANDEKPLTTTLFTDLPTSMTNVNSSEIVNEDASIPNEFNITSLPITESTTESEKNYPVELVTAAYVERPPTTTLITDLLSSTSSVDSSMAVHDNTSVTNKLNGSSLPIAESTPESKKYYPVEVVTVANEKRPLTMTLFTDLPTSTSIVDSSMVVHQNDSVPNNLNASSLPTTESTTESEKKYPVEVVTTANDERPPTTTLLTDLPSSTLSVDSSMAVHDNTSVPNKLNVSLLPIAESTPESEKSYPVEVVIAANEERPPTTTFITDLTTSTPIVDSSMAVHENTSVPNRLNGSALPIAESTTESEKKYVVEVVTAANEERLPTTTLFTDLATPIVVSSMAVHDNTSVPNKLNGSSLPIAESTPESGKSYPVEVVTAANDEKPLTTTLFTDLPTSMTNVNSSEIVNEDASIPNEFNITSLPITESTTESEKNYPVELVTAAYVERPPTTTLITDLLSSTSSVDSSMAVHDNTSVTNKLNGSSLPIAESTPESKKYYPVEVVTVANEKRPLTMTLFTDLPTSTSIVDSSMVVHQNDSVPNNLNASSLPTTESTTESEKKYPVEVVTTANDERPPTTTLLTDLPSSTLSVDSSMAVHDNTSVPNKLNVSLLPIAESTPESEKSYPVEVVIAANEERPPTTTFITDLTTSTPIVDSSMAVHENTSVPNRLNGSALPIAESTLETQKSYPVEVVTAANDEKPLTTILFTDLPTSTSIVDSSMVVHQITSVPNKLNGSSLPITESTPESEKKYVVEVVTAANDERLPATTLFTDITTSTPIVDSSTAVHDNTSVPNRLNSSSLPIAETTLESEKSYSVEVVTAANDEKPFTTTLFTDLPTSTTNVNSSEIVNEDASVSNEFNITSLPITEITPESEKNYPVELVTTAYVEKLPTTTLITDLLISTLNAESSTINEDTPVSNEYNSSLPRTDKNEIDYQNKIFMADNQDIQSITTLDSSMIVTEDLSVPNELNGTLLHITESTPENEINYPKITPESVLNDPESIPDSEINYPEITPESETNYPESIPDSEINYPEITPEGEMNYLESTSESEVNYPETTSESEVNYSKISPESVLNDPESIPDSEINYPEVTPESEINYPESTPENEINYPKITPESVLNDPESIPDSEINYPEVTPESEINYPESTPESEVNPEITPDNEINYSESSPRSELNNPEDTPESKINYPETTPESVMTYPESTPESEINYPRTTPEGEINYPENTPESEIGFDPINQSVIANDEYLATNSAGSNTNFFTARSIDVNENPIELTIASIDQKSDILTSSEAMITINDNETKDPNETVMSTETSTDFKIDESTFSLNPPMTLDYRAPPDKSSFQDNMTTTSKDTIQFQFHSSSKNENKAQNEQKVLSGLDSIVDNIFSGNSPFVKSIKAFGSGFPVFKNINTQASPQGINYENPFMLPPKNVNRPPYFSNRPLTNTQMVDSFFSTQKNSEAHERALKEARQLIENSKRSDRIINNILKNKNKYGARNIFNNLV